MSLGKQLHRLNVWETIEGSFKVGLPGINGVIVITPISRVVTPVTPLFPAIYRGYISMDS